MENITSWISWVQNIWRVGHPPQVAKTTDAIRLGILGAGWIADLALFPPARSHPEVIIAAVAARDPKRASAYAKKNGIPIVHNSYQDLLDDSNIDAVYIPLPNALHYEWAARALRAGKHVLLEKPFTSNANEAQSLEAIHAFLHSTTPASLRPVLLEAFHIKFHPAWQAFLALLSPPDVERVDSVFTVPAGFFRQDDIRFKYDLGGGSLMDIGCYNILTLREIFAAEPTECLAAEGRIVPYHDQECDEAFKATFRFPNGGIGTIYSDNSRTGFFGVPLGAIPKVVVRHKEVILQDEIAGETRARRRTVTMWMFPGPQLWHSIDILDEFVVRKADDGTIVKTWTDRESRKAYVWSKNAEAEAAQKGLVRKGEAYWSTYRHVLEQFVNKIKGRPGSGVWVDVEDSVKNMKAIDMAYEKAGMLLRPTSSYK